MASMGYREAALYLNGELTLEEAAQRIKYETHRFARRQYAWFRLADPRIRWLEAGPDMERQAEALAEKFLREASDCGKIASASEEIVE
jgi:tRNA dimethylallyltransferase